MIEARVYLNMFVDQILRLLPSLIKMKFAIRKVRIYPKGEE